MTGRIENRYARDLDALCQRTGESRSELLRRVLVNELTQSGLGRLRTTHDLDQYEVAS